MMSGSNRSQKVCVIGLGNMGGALAEALLANGHRVTVWNRTAAKCEPLANLGAEVVKTPAEAVGESDTVVICVLVHAIKSILSSDGMEEALNGKTVVQLSSMEPAESQAQDEWMRQHRARYLDGAILGFPADVRQGTARIAYSGSKEVFEDERDILSSLGDEPTYIGEQTGMAHLVATLVYARYYGITFACLHTAALAAATGISVRRFLDLTGGDERWQHLGRVMDQYLDMTEKRDYSTTEATLEVDAHDYNVFVRLSRELDVEPAFHELIETVLSKALAQGRGDQAIPAIFEVLSRSSNQ